jgi:hypothetical protein
MNHEQATDQASESDRVFFEKNAQRNYRLRPALANELPGLHTPRCGWMWVVVRQIRPGVRMRLAIHVPDVVQDDEALAASIWAGQMTVKS